MMISAMPRSRDSDLHQFEDLRLDGDVERGGRLVGDDQLRIAGQSDRDHHALAHAAGKLMRILLEPLLGIGDADQPQQFGGARVGVLLVHPEMELQRLDDLQPDRQHRVERGHRLLEDHRDFAAAHVRASPLRAASRRSRPSNMDAALRDAAGARQQPHDRMRGHRFAGAGFADQRYDLAGPTCRLKPSTARTVTISVAKLTCRSSTLSSGAAMGRHRRRGRAGWIAAAGYRRGERVPCGRGGRHLPSLSHFLPPGVIPSSGMLFHSVG